MNTDPFYDDRWDSIDIDLDGFEDEPTEPDITEPDTRRYVPEAALILDLDTCESCRAEYQRRQGRP